jgi:hypothetical protein
LLATHWTRDWYQNIWGAQKTKLPKFNDPIKKCATELNRTFSKEAIHTAKKHMEKCLPSLMINEMQIKTTLSYHQKHHQQQMLVKCGIKEPSYTAVWHIN